jgi:GT2 family glycosyltransferase
MTDALAVVRPGLGSPYASDVIATATRARSAVLLLGREVPEPLPEARLLDLLTGHFGIGAVIPRSVDPDRPGDAAVASDVSVVATEIVAMRADILRLAELDPRENDPRRVTGAALDAARSRGWRIVSEPTWTVDAAVDAEPTLTTAPTRVIVITGVLADGSLRTEDRAGRDLVQSLSEQCRHNELTVLAVERPGPVAAGWRARGVRVVDGPPDWVGSPQLEPGIFSHVVLTGSGLRSDARRWIETAQPQAAKVLFLPSLAFREVSALVPITPLDELSGLELSRVGVEARVAEQVRWADAVWCESERDAAFVRGLLPEVPVTIVPPAIEPSRPHVPLSERRGVVIAAPLGYDVIGGNEDAAVRALEDVLPQLRWRDPTLQCTVLSDSPTPMLAAAVQAAGATLAPARDLACGVATARVVLAVHGYGTGQPEVILTCLATGTPFIASPQAIGGLDLGPLTATALFAGVADIATRASQLLSDDAAWTQFAVAADQLLIDHYGVPRRTDALRAALAPLGITPGAVLERWPEVPRLPRRVTRRRSSPVELRPPGIAEPVRLSEGGPTTERERYALWTARHGPNPELLTAIREDLTRVTYRPLISILMPVHNTDASVLQDAIDSVRAQVYDNWQLCIADDGSTSNATLEVLKSFGAEKAIQVVHLPGASGISGATNAALALAEGEFVALLDHDDLLKPHALAQVARWLDADPDLDLIYSDEDKIDERGVLYDPHIKPDWSPDQLMAQNYVCHLTVARKALVERIGGFRSAFDGSQDFDLILRLTEHTDRIAHIPEPLYSWRAVPGSAAAVVDAKPYAIEAARRALADALVRRGYDGRVDTTAYLGCFRARYPIPGQPRVSIIIPTKNGLHLLRRCVDSVIDRSTYRNFDFLVVDNQSTEGGTVAYLADFPGRVIRYPHRFNYARMMNLAARSVECDALLFLNNDTEIITPDWIESLLEHAMRPEVGAVGGRLYFESGEPQHEGILVGVGGGWAHNLNHKGYWIRGDLVRNASAVTGACMMVRPSVFWEVGGNDERLRVAYNDVDLCLRIRQAGYQIVYTPAVELYHYESSSRGSYEHHEDGPLFGIRWHPKELGDPYYSPVFEVNRLFEIRV